MLLTPPDRELYEMEDVELLEPGEIILVRAGELIPADGEVIEGVASVNEAAITGESAPVIREAGGDRSSVTGGTTVASDWLVIRVTAKQGETFLDRMIAMVEGAKRQKSPTRSRSTSCWRVDAGLPVRRGDAALLRQMVDTTLPVIYLIALFVTLIPTTIGGLLSAIGIAGMDPAGEGNVIAKSAARWRRPATSTCCCSTRPAPSPSATAWPPPSCPWEA